MSATTYVPPVVRQGDQWTVAQWNAFFASVSGAAGVPAPVVQPGEVWTIAQWNSYLASVSGGAAPVVHDGESWSVSRWNAFFASVSSAAGIPAPIVRPCVVWTVDQWNEFFASIGTRPGTVGPPGPAGPPGPTGATGATGATGPNWTVGNGLVLSGNTISADTQGAVNATATAVINPAGLQSVVVNVGTVDTTITVNPGYQGQHLRMEIRQGATPHLVGFDSSVAFSADIPSFVATATANIRDLIQLLCLDGTHWGLAGVNKGFTT